MFGDLQTFMNNRGFIDCNLVGAEVCGEKGWCVAESFRVSGCVEIREAKLVIHSVKAPR
jgi:hypothetical protein